MGLEIRANLRYIACNCRSFRLRAA